MPAAADRLSCSSSRLPRPSSAVGSLAAAARAPCLAAAASANEADGWCGDLLLQHARWQATAGTQAGYLACLSPTRLRCRPLRVRRDA